MKTATEDHQNLQGKGLMERMAELSIPWRRVILYATLCGGFFLLGFLPMWLKAGEAMEKRDEAQRELRLIQLQNTLGPPSSMFSVANMNSRDRLPVVFI